MLMFESLDSIPYKELLEATKISEEHFPKFIQTLLDAKLLDCSTQVKTNNIVITCEDFSPKLPFPILNTFFL